MWTLIKDFFGILAFILGFLVALVDFAVLLIHVPLRWLRLTLYIESAQLLGMTKEEVAALHAQKGEPA